LFVLRFEKFLGLGFYSGFCACKTGVLPLELYLQSIWFWLFLWWGFKNYLLSLASNHHPPDLSFPSNQDYRREPLVSSLRSILSTKLKEDMMKQSAWLIFFWIDRLFGALQCKRNSTLFGKPFIIPFYLFCERPVSMPMF
jgi:hypothetical protein